MSTQKTAGESSESTPMDTSSGAAQAASKSSAMAILEDELVLTFVIG